MALWDDAFSWLTQDGQPFRSNNPTLDAMMQARSLPDTTQPRTTPAPSYGQSLMDLASTIAPYLVGAAPAGSTSAGMRLPGRMPDPAASDLPAPYIGQGTAAPLFDLSNLIERPNVPQTPIERMPPPAKDIPDWELQSLPGPRAAIWGGDHR